MEKYILKIHLTPKMSQIRQNAKERVYRKVIDCENSMLFNVYLIVNLSFLKIKLYTCKDNIV